MTRTTGISGILFLCMYCLILLHNTVPHHHCADTADSSSQTAHHEEHHHPGHAHDSESDSDNMLGFLLDFLGGLDHQENSNGELTWFIGEDAKLQLNAFDIGPLFAVIPANPPVLAEDSHIGRLCTLPPPSLSRLLPNLTPLRGPPSIS